MAVLFQIDAVFDRNDKDKDGKLSKHEFREMMCNKKKWRNTYTVFLFGKTKVSVQVQAGLPGLKKEKKSLTHLPLQHPTCREKSPRWKIQTYYEFEWNLLPKTKNVPELEKFENLRVCRYFCLFWSNISSTYNLCDLFSRWLHKTAWYIMFDFSQ